MNKIRKSKISTNSLGKLQKVPLRSVWEHEALSFTKWLADEENLDALGAEIGTSIKLIKTEAPVGGFQVDILAEEEGTGKKVIIENQLESTDHDHLGKLLTYASGVDASIVIWIFKDIRPEHRSAIDWINEHTDEDINIFAIQMELWQIDTSMPAPKFRIISSPNEWSKIARTDTDKTRLTPTALYQQDFWNEFNEYVADKDFTFNLRKIYPQHWYDFTIGSGAPCHLALTIHKRNKELGCELYIPDDNRLFDFLHSNKKDIEKQFGYKLSWQELPTKKASRIKIVKRSNIAERPEDFTEKTFSASSKEYTKGFEWMRTKLEEMKKVFEPYLADYQKSI